MHRSTPCRYFRTPPPLRAPPAATAVPPDGTSNSGTGNNGSRRDDDESKTDKSEKDGGIKKTSGQDGDENLFGELPITSSGQERTRAAPVARSAAATRFGLARCGTAAPRSCRPSYCLVGSVTAPYIDSTAPTPSMRR